MKTEKRLIPQDDPFEGSGLGTNGPGAAARFLSFLGAQPERRDCYRRTVGMLHRDVEQCVTQGKEDQVTCETENCG